MSAQQLIAKNKNKNKNESNNNATNSVNVCNTTSERIENDVESLVPFNDSPIEPAQVVTRSNSAREKKRNGKKQDSNHDNNNAYEIDNKGHQQRSRMKISRLQQNTINNNQ